MEVEDVLNLPEGWIKVSLEDVSIILTGNTPATNIPENYKGDILFYKPGDLNAGIIKDSIDKISIQGAQSSRILPAGSVLVTCIGSTIGKTAIITKEGAFNQQINGLLPINSNPYFFYYQIISPKFQKKIKTFSSSTTVPILNKTKFGRLSFLLAPIQEQDRIVAKIEEIFSDIEKNLELLNTISEQLKIYKKTILHNAFIGKLNEKKLIGSTYKTQDDLLSELVFYWNNDYNKKLDENVKGRQKKHSSIDLRKSNKDTLPDLPLGWYWVKLSDIVENVSLKVSPSKNPHFRFLGMDCIESNAMHPHKFYQFGEFKSAGNFFKQNQVLYGRMRPYLNKVWKADFEGACSGEFIVLQTYSGLSPDYLKYNLYSSRFVTFASEKASGDRPRISYDSMGEFLIPLCPLEEQLEIVENLDNLFSYVENLENIIKSTNAKSESLKQSVLHKAFSGKLIESSQDYESVNILLEQIKSNKLLYLVNDKEQREVKKTFLNKSKVMAEELKEIIEILKDTNEAIPSKVLWQKSKFSKDIEEYYAELKKLIESGQIEELPRNGKESLLKLCVTNENR